MCLHSGVVSQDNLDHQGKVKNIYKSFFFFLFPGMIRTVSAACLPPLLRCSHAGNAGVRELLWLLERCVSTFLSGRGCQHIFVSWCDFYSQSIWSKCFNYDWHENVISQYTVRYRTSKYNPCYSSCKSTA